ncbi:MAG: glycosyltransferase [Pseudomonadota bacterium]
MLSQAIGLSIVVSSYNYGRYLRTAIDSALGQDHDRLQIIVVDDGSTDDSIDIIKSYGRRIEAIFQENQGQVASCTAGLQRCRHDIVIFLDSDDRLEPFAAAEIMALWTPRTTKVQYALQAIDSEDGLVNTIFPKYPHSLTPSTIRAELLRAGVYPATTTSGTAFSKSFLEQVMPIPASYDCDIDDALNAAAPLYGDVQTLRKTLGQYRVHDRNTSAHSELTAERFERYVMDASERARYLADRCRDLGQALPDNVIENDLAYWESRLAAAVLKPGPRLALLAPTLRAAFSSILDPGQRAMHALWAIGLALAPRPIARHLLAERFIFNQRSRFAEGLLRHVWQLGRLTARLTGGHRARTDGRTLRDAKSTYMPLATAKGNDDARV